MHPARLCDKRPDIERELRREPGGRSGVAAAASIFDVIGEKETLCGSDGAAPSPIALEALSALIAHSQVTKVHGISEAIE